MNGQAASPPARQDFESLVVPMLDSLCRAAITLTGNEHEANDLVQAACVKACERFATFAPGSNCRAWMMRIMRNTWIDQLRHRRLAGKPLPLDEDLIAARPTDDGADGDFRRALERFSDSQIIDALRKLPEPQRLALLLSDVEEFSQDEVADVLDVAVGTVKSRLSRARAALRVKLEQHAREMGFLERRPCRT